MALSLSRANLFATVGAWLLAVCTLGLYAVLAIKVHNGFEHHLRTQKVVSTLRALEEVTRLRFRRVVEHIRLARYDALESGLTESGPVAHAQNATRRAIAEEIAFIRDEAARREEVEEIGELDAIVEETARAMKTLLDAGRTFPDVPREAAEARLREALSYAFDGRLQEMFREFIGKEEIEASETQAVLRDAVLLVLLLGGTTALVWPIFQFLVARRLGATLFDPLQRLRDALQSVHDRPAPAALSEEGAQEVGTIAAEFNRMTRQLETLRRAEIEARESLEGTVVERTRKLESATHSLIEADRRKSKFLSDISHELRTPLTLIRGEADIALRRSDAEPAILREALARVRNLSDQLAVLVDDLLFVARATEGQPKIDLQRHDLVQIANAAIADTTSLAARRGVVLQGHFPGRPLVRECDRVRMLQLLMILLDNAIRYCDSRVHVRINEDADGVVVLRVENDGPGLDPQDAASAFERFSRGKNGPALNPSGSGLGLPMARALARAHLGEIDLTSSPGEATVVEVRLPNSRVMA